MQKVGIEKLLSTQELDIFSQALELVEKEHARKSESRQLRKIVPIEEWIESEYYAGPDVYRIFPYWKKRIIEIFNSKTPINEIIFTGAIGTGKSTIALFILVRRLYEISCYENIPAKFHLMSSSLVAFLYFSLSKSQAELTGFGQIKNILDSIPYFRDYFQRNMNINSIIAWPNENLILTYGSEPSHMIGMNMLGSILDEANFFMNDAQDPNKSSNAATDKMSRMYSSIINRGKSRFLIDGVDYTLSILISSATTSTSFTEKRIAEAQGNPNVRVFSPAIWEVKPKDYGDEKFWVFCGDEGVDPFIVESLADVRVFTEAKGIPIHGDSIDESINNLPFQYKDLFVHVPEKLRNAFKVNIIQSLQDLAGRSVAPTGKLFNSKTAYNACISPDLRHPFTKDQIVISTGDTIKVSDYLIPGFSFKDSKKPHFIHIDQSVTTDYTGISMCHIDHYIEETYRKTEDGEDDSAPVKKAVIKMDFMLDILPPAPPRQISISKVRDFCFYLRDVMKVNIAKITYDWYACLSGDTLVRVPYGWVRLDSIKVGDVVLNDSGICRVNEVHKYRAPTITIKTKNQELTGTPNHRINVLKGWTEAKGELNEYYSYRIKSKRRPVFEEKPLSDIKEGDIVDIRYQRANLNKNVSLDDRMFWYLIGYVLGDGSWGKNGINYVFGSLKDAVHIRDILTSYDGQVRNIIKRKRSYDYWSLNCCSIPLMRTLSEKGFSFKGAHNKLLPQCVFELPIDAQLELINGLIDSGGAVTESTVKITTVSEQLAKDVVKLCTMYLGLDAHYSRAEGKDKKFPSGKIYHSSDVFVISVNGDKTILRDSLFKVKTTRLVCGHQRYVFQKVTSVEYKEESDVYDLSVNHDNHYIANCFYSHNSVESMQTLEASGIDSSHLSVDRTDEQYLAFVNLIMEGRIQFYDYPVLRRELFDLIWYRARRKVDHPGTTATGGTKDLCDSVVGAIWDALTSETKVDNYNDDVQSFISINRNDDNDADILFRELYGDIMPNESDEDEEE